MTWGQLARRSRLSIDQISEATAAGGIAAGTVPRCVERHLRNRSIKAVALRKVTEFAAADKRVALEQAGRIDLFQPHRGTIRWRYEPKSYGRYRMVCDLPNRLRVAQHMAKELLRAQHTPRAHIFDWPERGGCPAAVARTREAIDAGYRFLVVADIRDCHDTFDPAYIYQTNLLPPEFIRATLDSREFRYGLRDDVPYGHNHTEHARPRGLLQGGAASSTFLALALDDLPDHLPSDVVPITQSDNIILARRSQVECEAAADALGCYLSDNPAGAFSPRIEKVWMRANPLVGAEGLAATWVHWFEQFGYSFQLDARERCQVELSHANLMKLLGRMHEHLEGLPAHQPPIHSFERELEGQLAGFPALSAGSVEFIRTVLEPDYVRHSLSRQRATSCEPEVTTDDPPWED